MKKLKSLVAVAFAAVLLTSCLGGGDNSQSFQSIGVTGYDKTGIRMLLYLDDVNAVYVPTIANDPNFMGGNDCVQFYGTLNYDSPENANAAANGYYTMTVEPNAYAKMDKWSVESSVMDTVNRMPGEQVFRTVLDGGAVLIKNNLFVSTSYPSIVTNQKNKFYLSYDMSKGPVTVNDKRVYDLYIRMVKVADGNGSTIQNPNDIAVFDGRGSISYIFNSEQATGAEKLNLRINYPKEFSKDSTKITAWGSEIASLNIPKKAE